MKIGESEPGNGMRYTAIAIPWENYPDGAQAPIMVGALGSVSKGWLVVSGLTGQAHLFQEDGTLVDRYIHEKLGGSAARDYPYFGDLIRDLTER